MQRIPEVGERVYAWRPEVQGGVASKRRVAGLVVDVIGPWTWLDRAIYVRMDDTGEVEHYGHDQLDEISEES